MRKLDRSSRILLAGAVVSVLMHAAMMLGFVRWSQAAVLSLAGRPPEPPHTRTEPPKPKQPEKPQDPVIKLGIEKSDAAMMTWIGFEEATEHQAPEGVVEQSAMTMAPPGTKPAPMPEQGAPPAPPVQAQAAPPAAEAAPTAEVPAPAPQIDARQLAEQVKDFSEKVAAAQERLTEALGKLAQAIPAPPVHPATEGPPPPPPSKQQVAAAPAQAAPAAAQPTAVAAKPAPQQPATEGGGMPGIKANKEAIAVSIKKAPTVRPGKVVAAQGLDIQTREPRWAYTTLLTRRPKNPTVSITFGRDGKVVQADFVSDGAKVYNTGYDDVDEPLMAAIYAWTAKGKALSEISADDPKAGVTVLITIILAG